MTEAVPIAGQAPTPRSTRRDAQTAARSHGACNLQLCTSTLGLSGGLMGSGATPLTMAMSMKTATAAVGAASTSAAIAGATTAKTAVPTSPIWVPVVTGAAVVAAVLAVAAGTATFLQFACETQDSMDAQSASADRVPRIYAKATYSMPLANSAKGWVRGYNGLVFKCTLHTVWQAWHLWHWAGSGGALGSHLSPWTRQAWHLEASTSILCGRRVTWRKCLGATVFGHTWHTTISHTTLTHTTLSHIALSHNLSSTISTQLIPTFSHTTFSRKQLSHTQLTPTGLSHTTLSYAPLSHNLSPTMSTQLTHTLSHTQFADTQPSHKQLSRNFIIRTSFTQSASWRLHRTHTYFTFSNAYYKPSHTQPSYTELSHSICSTISFLLPAFPIPSSPFFCYLLGEIWSFNLSITPFGCIRNWCADFIEVYFLVLIL